MANADALRPLQTAPPKSGGHPLSGTVTAPGQNSVIVVGTGTRFLSELAACSSKGGNPSAYSCAVQGVTSYAGLADGKSFWLPDVSCAPGATLDVNGMGVQPLFWDGKPVAAANCPAKVFRRLFYNPGAHRIDVGGETPLMWLWWNSPRGSGTGTGAQFHGIGSG